MKQIILIMLAAGCLLNACKKAEELKYSQTTDNVWLYLFNADKDSLLRTFAYTPTKPSDTVYVPVIIAGVRKDYPRKFVFRILKDSSTAVENVHYKPMADYYLIEANTGFTNVPLIIYNKDTMLSTKSVTIKFRLEGTDDLGVNIPDLVRGKLVFSSKLERPSWWGMWFGEYYSRVKHEFFLFTTDQIDLSTSGLDAPKNQYFVNVVSSFMANPSNWILKNPSKGFVMDLRADGNYDFYNKNTPSKKYLYRKNVQNNKFYFVDELNKDMI